MNYLKQQLYELRKNIDYSTLEKNGYGIISTVHTVEFNDEIQIGISDFR